MGKTQHLKKIRFREYLFENTINRFEIDRGKMLILLYKDGTLHTKIFFGKKYDSCNGQDLYNNGEILFDGYDNKNWIQIATEKFGFKLKSKL